MIDQVKKILNITDNDVDDVLEIYQKFVMDYIKAYCNITEIPCGLDSTVALMIAVSYMSNEQKKRVSIGDISIEFNTQDKFGLYKSILNKYRKVGF